MRKIFFLGLLVCSCLFAKDISQIRFLIPGGIGSGWDITARNIGKALQNSKLISRATYINMSGGGGSKAMNFLLRTQRMQGDTLFINSTPIVIKSIQDIQNKSYHDLSLVASVVADYQVIATTMSSSIKSIDDLLKKYDANPSSVRVGGGSIRGSLDHLVFAGFINAAGKNVKNINYKAFNGGRSALDAMLLDEVNVISVGLSEIIEEYENQEINILAIASNERVQKVKDIKTLKEQGIDFSFINWRGFFAIPRMQDNKIQDFVEVLSKMYQTKEWQNIKEKYKWEDYFFYGNDFKLNLKKQEEEINKLLIKLDMKLSLEKYF